MSVVSQQVRDIFQGADGFKHAVQAVRADPSKARSALLHAVRLLPRAPAKVLECATDGQGEDAPAEEDAHACPECGKVFPSLQQCFSHRHKVHQYMCPLRARIQSTCCLCCGKDYWHPARLLKHLRQRASNNKCAVHYLAMEPLEPAEVRAFEAGFTALAPKVLLPPPMLR